MWPVVSPSWLVVAGALLLPIEAFNTTISNLEPRIDWVTGKPVNAHSGNIVKVGSTFFLYGEYYGEGPYVVTGTVNLPRLSV